jgi:hypothetical protein
VSAHPAERPHNVVVPFANVDAAMSFLALVDELGYRGVVMDAAMDAGADEAVDPAEYEDTSP